MNLLKTLLQNPLRTLPIRTQIKPEPPQFNLQTPLENLLLTLLTQPSLKSLFLKSINHYTNENLIIFFHRLSALNGLQKVSYILSTRSLVLFFISAKIVVIFMLFNRSQIAGQKFDLLLQVQFV
jgi:hypothetical protein